LNSSRGTSPAAGSALRIVFAGTPAFALPALRALRDSSHQLVAVYTRPDRPAGRGRKLAASPVKTVAVEARLPVYQPESLKGDEAAHELAALQPDLMVVVAYGLILPPDILDVPRVGCWNVHASLLPRWRGAAPIERAILAGDKTTGVTIMQMNAGLDTGDMLLRRETSIGPQETGGALHERLAELGAEALLDALQERAAGTLHPRPQDDSLACYAERLTRDEAQLDWGAPAELLARKIRAFNPRLVARAEVAGEALKIWEAQTLSVAVPAGAPPGKVIAAGRAGIDVATGSRVLRLLRIQCAGRQPVTAADYLNARPDLRTG
jgi:methionyl-tRNA formyltransferase